MSQDYAVARIEVPVAVNADMKQAESVALEAAQHAITDPAIAARTRSRIIGTLWHGGLGPFADPHGFRCTRSVSRSHGPPVLVHDGRAIWGHDRGDHG